MTAGQSFVYLDIAESVRRQIVSGELAAGDRLPSVRAMAARWECTPNTVGRAYALLAAEALVHSRRGGGTRVAPRPVRPGMPAPPEWQWASLVNRAENYLLEAVGQGHSPAHAEAALVAAIARWQELRRQPGTASLRDTEGSGVAGQEEQLRFAGSHDLSVEALGRFLSEAPSPVKLTTDFVGSLGGLMALSRGEADLAGSHLWDADSQTYNVAHVGRVLPNRGVVLVNLVQRVQGLIVPPGNPQELAGLADLVGPGVLFVNRQFGSGTRVWLDLELENEGIHPADVKGYDQERSTHMAVAKAVAEREATVGLGIGAAAAAYGLDFVPVGKERYDLVVPVESWDAPAMVLLRSVVSSEEYREAVSALGGYDISDMGRETRLD